MQEGKEDGWNTHQRSLLLLQVRPLSGHSHAQQLVRKAIPRDHEVEQCDLRGGCASAGGSVLQGS